MSSEKLKRSMEKAYLNGDYIKALKLSQLLDKHIVKVMRCQYGC